MKVSDFKAHDLFAFSTETTLWEKGVTVNVDFNDEYDLMETLTSYIDVINDRLSWLEENRAAVLSALHADSVADKLKVPEESLADILAPDELTVYCDDGRNNVWTDLFLVVGEVSVEVSLSPDNICECKGICS